MVASLLHFGTTSWRQRNRTGGCLDLMRVWKYSKRKGPRSGYDLQRSPEYQFLFCCYDKYLDASSLGFTKEPTAHQREKGMAAETSGQPARREREGTESRYRF